MIDSQNPEENKTSDAEMFFAQFQEGAPAKAEMPKDEAEFVDQAEKAMTQKVASKQPTFKEAFAAARKAGGKAFEFNGKKYTTEIAKPKAPSVSKIGNSTSTADIMDKSPAPAKRPSVYADNFIQDGINKIKSKLSEKGSESKTLPNGKPNLTAAQ